MPVRIYDIAKKYGLENIQILAKAKSLGIAAAKVPSSSLDMASASWLEGELLKEYPELAAKLQSPTVAAPPPSTKAQITITVTGGELYNLVERILNDEVQLNLNIAESENSEPLHVSLARAGGQRPIELKPKPDSLPQTEIDAGTKNILNAAYWAARRSTEDWINLADFGSAVKKLEPTFQPQKFGERSLGSLLRRVSDLFELKNDESNPIVYYLRMRSGQSASPPSNPAQPASPRVGVLPKVARGKIHNLRLGFGFIMPDDGSENAFFHATELEGCTIFDLKPGDRVEYEPGFNEKGPCARRIRRVSE